MIKKRTLSSGAGFTLVELLATLIAGFGLTLVVLPALAKSRSAGAGIGCLNNQRLLTQAFLLYAAENQGYFPPNPDDGNTVPGNAWVAGLESIAGSAATNQNYLLDPRYSLLAPHLPPNPKIFKCPADNQPPLGSRYVRSYSMNGAVGTLPPGKAPVNGPWLDGNHGHTANTIWYCYGKFADLVKPAPADLFVFMDEDTDSINDSVFATIGPGPQQQLKMIDWPTTRHDYGAGIGFADGHAEIHRWADSRTEVINGNVGVAFQPNNPDIAWLANHATAPIAK